MEKVTDCPSCGGAVKQTGRGRPRTYCAETCRRVAEYDVRRIQAHLTRAEKAEQEARLNVALGYGPTRAAALAKWWSAEVERLRGRLRALLAAQGAALA